MTVIVCGSRVPLPIQVRLPAWAPTSPTVDVGRREADEVGIHKADGSNPKVGGVAMLSSLEGMAVRVFSGFVILGNFQNFANFEFFEISKF